VYDCSIVVYILAHIQHNGDISLEKKNRKMPSTMAVVRPVMGYNVVVTPGTNYKQRKVIFIL